MFSNIAKWIRGLGSNEADARLDKSDQKTAEDFLPSKKPTDQAREPYNDEPIEKPDSDLFNFDALARALARSIEAMQAPKGTVVAINGPWGAGKSSVVNLVRHHLNAAVSRRDIVIIPFNCWWCRGEEALALAFFRELFAGMSPTVTERARKALPKLGARLLKAGGTIGEVASAAGLPVPAGATGKATEFLAGLIDTKESVETLYSDLATALGERATRYLVIIDDIDRLSPEEALLVFRLVKSAARLPNVIYLLAYDRVLAERIVSDRFPAEGPHYLEKIVQATFEIPTPSISELCAPVTSYVDRLLVDRQAAEGLHAHNLLHEIVLPELRTPRDALRLINLLNVTWPAVGTEVNVGDFVTLEFIRSRNASLYRAIQTSRDRLAGVVSALDRRDDAQRSEYDRLLIDCVSEGSRERYRHGLKRLFPRLEAIFGNLQYGADAVDSWSRARRVCAPSRFDAYFRFAPSAEVLTSAEANELLACAPEFDRLVGALRGGVKISRASGTKAAVMLEELRLRAKEISLDHAAATLRAVFAVADELDVPEDRSSHSWSTNSLRIHWFIRQLTFERTTLEQRSTWFVEACQSSSIGWLVDFASSAWAQYHPREGREIVRADNCLVTAADAEYLRGLALARIVAAAGDGSLLSCPSLGDVLYRWADFADDNGAGVRTWTAQRLADDKAVITLANVLTQYSTSQSFGDRVAQRRARIDPKSLQRVIDTNSFRKRVEEIDSRREIPELKACLAGWRRYDEGEG